MTFVTADAVRDLVERVCAGDVRALARVIWLVENDAPVARGLHHLLGYVNASAFLTVPSRMASATVAQPQFLAVDTGQESRNYPLGHVLDAFNAVGKSGLQIGDRRGRKLTPRYM